MKKNVFSNTVALLSSVIETGFTHKVCQGVLFREGTSERESGRGMGMFLAHRGWVGRQRKTSVMFVETGAGCVGVNEDAQEVGGRSFLM